MSQATGEAGTVEDTAPGPLPEELYGQLPNWEFKLWPSSTNVIMASLFLALGFIISMQIAERLDTIMFGGTIPLWGTVLFTPWMIAGPLFFGLTGGLIVANINPIVANLTGTSPLAPLFFPANTIYAVAVALMAWYLKEPGEGLRFKHIIVIQLVAGALNPWVYIIYQRLVLDFTWGVIAGLVATAYVLGIGSMFVTYPFVKKLLESGVVQTQ